MNDELPLRRRIQELTEMLHGKVCDTDGCVMECEEGSILCIHCLHGQPSEASEELIEAKRELDGCNKRLQRLAGKAK